MELKLVVTCLAVSLFFSALAESKSVTKPDVQDQEEKQQQLEVNTASDELQTSGSGNEEDDTVDCDEKLRKCNIVCKKAKALDKRNTCDNNTCTCNKQMCKNGDPEKRQKECDKTKCKKCASHSHGHGVEKRFQTTECKKKANCACSKKASSPIMQRLFSFPAIMIAPIKGYSEPEKEVQPKNSTVSKKCCCHDCCCCCCEPCCCCHECCCCPCCCCCCEPCCCCCDCCHHCCHHCCDHCHHCCDHCCDHCCCKKSGAQGATRPGPQGGK